MGSGGEDGTAGDGGVGSSGDAAGGCLEQRAGAAAAVLSNREELAGAHQHEDADSQPLLLPHCGVAGALGGISWHECIGRSLASRPFVGEGETRHALCAASQLTEKRLLNDCHMVAHALGHAAFRKRLRLATVSGTAGAAGDITPDSPAAAILAEQIAISPVEIAATLAECEPHGRCASPRAPSPQPLTPEPRRRSRQHHILSLPPPCCPRATSLAHRFLPLAV